MEIAVSPKSTQAPSSRDRTIRPRQPRFALGATLPRHWFGGSAVATHLANGVNLLFPAGERFFVRSVRRFIDRIEDPTLREAARGFYAQEGRHAQAHEHVFEILEAQGYSVRTFLAVYERVAFGLLEPAMPAKMNLAVTAALEHFTAIMAKDALRNGRLKAADPAMRALLSWHAAEEIEHRAVAFDVLREVDPSQALRVSGMAFGAALLGAFWLAGTMMLLAQDGRLNASAIKELRALRAQTPNDEGIVKRVFLAGIREYLRPDFHPLRDEDADALAESYLESAGLA